MAISGFGPDQYHQLSQLGSKASAPGLTTPDALADAVSGTLEIVETGEAHRQQLFENPTEVLRHLRRTGGVNARAQGAWSKTRLARFSADYIHEFGTEGGVSLTYHPVWIIARKPG